MEIMSLLCGLRIVNEMPHKHNSMLVDLQDRKKQKMYLSLHERHPHHTLVPYVKIIIIISHQLGLGWTALHCMPQDCLPSSTLLSPEHCTGHLSPNQ